MAKLMMDAIRDILSKKLGSETFFSNYVYSPIDHFVASKIEKLSEDEKVTLLDELIEATLSYDDNNDGPDGIFNKEPELPSGEGSATFDGETEPSSGEGSST